MNLHAIAGPAIAAVNPFTNATWLRSTGNTTAADGARSPSFAAPVTISAQIQSLSVGDIRLLDGLQLQGEQRKIYVNGLISDINRTAMSGGDIIKFPDGNVWPFGTTWKVTQTLEQFPDWCCVAVVQQTPGEAP